MVWIGPLQVALQDTPAAEDEVPGADEDEVSGQAPARARPGGVNGGLQSRVGPDLVVVAPDGEQLGRRAEELHLVLVLRV